jgi:hypothetical protein
MSEKRAQGLESQSLENASGPLAAFAERLTGRRGEP